MFDLDPFITIWTSNLDHELKYPLKTIKVEPTNSNGWFSGIVYGPLQAHVYRQDKSKGVMEKPSLTYGGYLSISLTIEFLFSLYFKCRRFENHGDRAASSGEMTSKAEFLQAQESLKKSAESKEE